MERSISTWSWEFGGSTEIQNILKAFIKPVSVLFPLQVIQLVRVCFGMYAIEFFSWPTHFHCHRIPVKFKMYFQLNCSRYFIFSHHIVAVNTLSVYSNQFENRKWDRVFDKRCIFLREFSQTLTYQYSLAIKLTNTTIKTKILQIP